MGFEDLIVLQSADDVIDLFRGVGRAQKGVKVVKYAKEKFFEIKFTKFVSGLYDSEKELLKFVAVITEDYKTTNNAARLIEIINKCEDIEKIDFLINVTRAFFSGFIVKEDYFRICNAILNCIYEDLIFVRDHIFDKQLAYNDGVQILISQGIVYQSSVDADGNQSFSFTHFAHMIDQFAISYEDVNRYPNPTKIADAISPKVDLKAYAVWG